jgi:hypothetical protein
MNPNGDKQDHEKEWADMKTGWQATSVAEDLMIEKLRWGLRLRKIGSWLALGLDVVGALFLTLIAVIEFARGNVVAAAAVTLLNIICAAASIWARRSPLRRAAGHLLELIDLTIHGARRSERFAWAQYFTCAATIVFVVAMFFGNDGGGIAPYDNPVAGIFAVIALVIYAVGVGIHHRYARRRGRRFTELRRSFFGSV